MVADLNLDVLTVGSARAAVQERQTTATALVENLYEKIDAQDRQPGQINAYLNLTRDRALKQAKRMDAIVDRGDPLPPLGGVPIAIKDVMVMQGVRTTAGSKILGNYVPPYDCTATVLLSKGPDLALTMRIYGDLETKPQPVVWVDFTVNVIPATGLETDDVMRFFDTAHERILDRFDLVFTETAKRFFSGE